LYRLSPTEVADLGLEETGLDGVLAVEWPDRWISAPASAIHVVIEDLAGTDREIRIRRQ
jgi:tRNA A37 threonylcarbamoyladenosine biosynthesis protein TsaE